MLASKGAPSFHNRFLEFVVEELKGEVDIIEGKNQGLSEDVILQFFGAAIVGSVEGGSRTECLYHFMSWQNKQGNC